MLRAYFFVGISSNDYRGTQNINCRKEGYGGGGEIKQAKFSTDLKKNRILLYSVNNVQFPKTLS
jgi:hypothetical protein